MESAIHVIVNNEELTREQKVGALKAMDVEVCGCGEKHEEEVEAAESKTSLAKFSGLTSEEKDGILRARGIDVDKMKMEAECKKNNKKTSMGGTTNVDTLRRLYGGLAL
jgi:hypothetical protein